MNFAYTKYEIQPSSTNPSGIIHRPEVMLRVVGKSGDTHLMALPTQVALDALLDRLSELGDAGRLRVESAYDPAAGDLRSVGRALLLSYRGSVVLSPGAIAALAHLAGFTWVRLMPDGLTIYASVAPGDVVGIAGGSAFVLGQALTLSAATFVCSEAFVVAASPVGVPLRYVSKVPWYSP